MDRETLSIPGIYAIRRVGTSDFYIGQSINIRCRWKTHRQDFKNGRHASKFMQRVYDKHGADIFEYIVLETGFGRSDKLALAKAEQEWIDFINPVYNTAKVAGSCLGVKHSEETREKHRLAMLGNKHAVGSAGRRGKKMTPEQCARISAALKGKPKRKHGPMPDEVKLKLSLAKTGVPQSEETRRKRSESMSGRPWSEKRRAAHVFAGSGAMKGILWWSTLDGFSYRARNARSTDDVRGKTSRRSSQHFSG